MTTDAHRDGEAETDVRLTGLVARLTSPSRNDGKLVDIWFEIERRERTCAWDDAFARVAEGWRPDKRHQSHFALLSHPSICALIVARQVSSDRAVWREIEIEARALVGHVNRAVAELRMPAVQDRPPVVVARGAGTAPAASPRNWLSEVVQSMTRGLLPKPSIPVSHSSSTGAR